MFPTKDHCRQVTRQQRWTSGFCRILNRCARYANPITYAQVIGT